MMKFRKRKAVQHGHSLFINLPKLWIDNVNVQKGDELTPTWDEKNGRLYFEISGDVE